MGSPPDLDASGNPVANFKTTTVGDTSQLDALDRLIGLMPAAGGMAGGIIGGVGGTVLGVGVGGVPGAAGGAALGGAAGESLRQLIELARGHRHDGPVSATSAAKGIGTQGAVQGASELVGAGVGKAVTTGAKAVYRGYLKPSLSARMAPKANEIVDTAIAEGLAISRVGAQKAQRIITELRTAVDGILAKTTGTIDLHQVAQKVRAFAKNRYYKPGVDPSDYEAALKVADNLDTHAALNLPAGVKPSRVDVSLSDANASKRGLYTSIKEAGFGTPQGAKKTTEKFAANQLKTGLEKAAASIAPLNARESKLIDAAKTISRAVEREANQNPLYGVKTLASMGVGGGIGAASGQDPVVAAALAFGARQLLRPAVASRLAITASRLSKQLGVTAATASRLAYFAMLDMQQQSEGQGQQ
jgi:hypothetical protein